MSSLYVIDILNSLLISFHSERIYTMLKKIASMLDDVANTLEAHGLIKEAFEIDKVSVKIDSLSVQPPAGVAPPQDIDRLFPNIHINLSTRNSYKA
jgi:hypothetical protein